jgi:uncharacterized repeat protein (TIGR04138 family)
MNFRDELARVIAQDPRYSIEAYAFVLESLNHARQEKLKARKRERGKARSTEPAREPAAGGPGSKAPRKSGHVSGSELCESVRTLSLSQFGLLAATVLEHWGVRSTSDIGDIVYNLIAAGDLEKTPTDSRSDFDDVFDFSRALRPNSLREIAEAAKEGS